MCLAQGKGKKKKGKVKKFTVKLDRSAGKKLGIRLGDAGYGV